jgi:hypothetical protein
MITLFEKTYMVLERRVLEERILEDWVLEG